MYTIQNCNKTIYIECTPETKCFLFFIYKYDILKNKDDIKDSEDLAYLQSKVKQVRVVEKLGKHCFHYDTKELFVPITKTVLDASQNIFEETKSTKKAIEELDESTLHVKTLELMKKNGVVHSNLIRPIAKHLLPTKRPVSII